jgi:hypothetical protein
MANYKQQLTGVIDYSCTQGGFTLELWLQQESTMISSVWIYDVSTAFHCVVHRQTVQKTWGANHRPPLFKAIWKRTIAEQRANDLRKLYQYYNAPLHDILPVWPYATAIRHTYVKSLADRNKSQFPKRCIDLQQIHLIQRTTSNTILVVGPSVL